MKKQDLSYSERFILIILCGLGVCRIKDLTILSGYTNMAYMGRKLNEFAKLGYVAYDFYSKEKFYYLKAKGYAELNRRINTYRINHMTYHDLHVSRIATALYIMKNISFLDLVTDRQMFYYLKTKRNIHRPDILLENTCYEFERTLKNRKEIIKNLNSNAERFEKQIWIIPDEKPELKNIIQKLAKSQGIQDIEFWNLSFINKIISDYKLCTNSFRFNKVLGERQLECLTKNYKHEDKLQFLR